MNFSRNITSEGVVLYAFIILGVLALTLIALPMGVFAQENDEVVLQAASSTVENVAVAPAHYDNYKREQLPDSRSPYDDFVVGPGRFSLEIAPGESKTVMMNVSNRLGKKRLFRFTTEDMTSNEDGGTATIQLLGDEVGPYTIKDYISVPYESFFIEHNERAVIPVTVSLPPDAEPGGFYGSILTEVMPEEQDPGESDIAPSATLVSRIGTLFYVTTPGDVEREGKLLKVQTIPSKKLFFKGPVDLGLVYENTGSVHLTPYGSVTVTNMLGDAVGSVELDPWFVMPQSIKTREISWDREFLMGRYLITADIEKGYDNQVDSASVVIWVLPWKHFIVIFGAVFIFFLLLRFLSRNFEFKRK